MFDTIDEDSSCIIVDNIEYSVVSAPDAITLSSGKLLNSKRSWVVDKEGYVTADALDLFDRQLVEIALGDGLNDYFVCHASSGIQPMSYLCRGLVSLKSNPDDLQEVQSVR